MCRLPARNCIPIAKALRPCQRACLQRTARSKPRSITGSHAGTERKLGKVSQPTKKPLSMKLTAPIAEATGRRPIVRRKAYMPVPAMSRKSSVAQPRAFSGSMR